MGYVRGKQQQQQQEQQEQQEQGEEGKLSTGHQHNKNEPAHVLQRVSHRQVQTRLAPQEINPP